MNLPSYFVGACLAVLTSSGFAQSSKPSPQPAQTAASATSPADRDFEAFETLAKGKPRGTPQDLGAEAYFSWLNDQQLKINAAGLTFYQAYPADPRRWEVVLALVNTPLMFATGFRADVATKGPAAAIVDEQAKATWEMKAEALKRALLAATDSPLAGCEQVEWGNFAKDFRATAAAMKEGKDVDWGVFRSRFDTHVLKYEALDIVVARAADYLGALERNQPEAAVREWTHLAEASTHPALRSKAAEKVEYYDRMSRPLSIAFTAVDGRKVDLAALRGKVVLVDFWATWCGPCIAELPNVKAVYSAYHDKGFEIIGISLENAKIIPGDNPERVAAKMETAKKIRKDFTTKEAMPWPQYFDGKWWKNELSTAYSINAIPAMFLIDKTGKVVSTAARGAMLEKEVKRLLGEE